MATYSNGAFNQNPRSDSRHAPSTPILIQDVPACFASRRFLKRRLTADIRLSAFPTLRPLCSLSLPGARFSYEKKPPRCKIQARSYDFSKERFVQADDPQKQIKSAEVYRYIYIYRYTYQGRKVCIFGRTVKSKLDLTISSINLQEICSGSLIRVTCRYIPKESKDLYETLNSSISQKYFF